MVTATRPPEYTYYGGDGGDSSHAGTDSDTESSCGEEDTRPEGLSAQLNGPLSHLPDAEKEQHLYWAYKTTKGNWRKFMRKPVRKVRRYFRKEAEGGWKGKGKGQSKSKGKRLSGKGISAYVAELSDEAYEETFFGKGKGKGRGKGKGKRSSGKGMGSRKNPVGRDGTVMKCFGNGGTCGSEFHLKRDCPHETGNASTASPTAPSTFYVGTFTELWMVTNNVDQPSEEADYVQDAQLEPSQGQEAPLEVHTEYIFMLEHHETPVEDELSGTGSEPQLVDSSSESESENGEMLTPPAAGTHWRDCPCGRYRWSDVEQCVCGNKNYYRREVGEPSPPWFHFYDPGGSRR